MIGYETGLTPEDKIIMAWQKLDALLPEGYEKSDQMGLLAPDRRNCAALVISMAARGNPEQVLNKMFNPAGKAKVRVRTRGVAVGEVASSNLLASKTQERLRIIDRILSQSLDGGDSGSALRETTVTFFTEAGVHPIYGAEQKDGIVFNLLAQRVEGELWDPVIRGKFLGDPGEYSSSLTSQQFIESNGFHDLFNLNQSGLAELLDFCIDVTLQQQTD